MRELFNILLPTGIRDQWLLAVVHTADGSEILHEMGCKWHASDYTYQSGGYQVILENHS